jgi:hypothetical protein
MGSGPYQILMLGADDGRRNDLQSLVSKRVTELGLDTAALRFISESEAGGRDRRAPIMAIFFRAAGQASDTPLIAELIDDSIVIAPIVSSTNQVHAHLPPQLRHVNALEAGQSGGGIGRLATLIWRRSDCSDASGGSSSVIAVSTPGHLQIDFTTRWTRAALTSLSMCARCLLPSIFNPSFGTECLIRTWWSSSIPLDSETAVGRWRSSRKRTRQIFRYCICSGPDRWRTLRRPSVIL